MALAGTHYGPWLGSGYHRVYLTWTATQNIANNTSTISAHLVWDNSSGYALSSSVAKSVSITIDGTTYTGTSTVGIATKSTKTLISATHTITHSSDGTRSFSISGVFDLQFTLGGTYYASTSASGTNTLDSIPRTSSIASIIGGTLGQLVTVNINRASTSFTHALYYVRPDGVNVYIGAGFGASASFTPAVSDANYITQASTATGRVIVETYSGSTHIGSTTGTFTLVVPDSVVPSGSVGIVGENLFNGLYMQGMSRANITISGAGIYGSSIVSQYTEIVYGGNIVFSSGSSFFVFTALNGGDGTYYVNSQVTDSRGKRAWFSNSFYVTGYVRPRITSLTAYRSNSSGNEDPQGSYLRIVLVGSITSLGGANPKASHIAYKLKGASAWTTLVGNADSYNPTLQITTPIASDQYYEIRGYVADYFTSNEIIRNVGPAFSLVDFHSSGKNMAIGQIATGNGVLQVKGKATFDGSIVLSTGSYMTGGVHEGVLSQKELSVAGWYRAFTFQKPDLNIAMGAVGYIMDLAIIRAYSYTNNESLRATLAVSYGNFVVGGKTRSSNYPAIPSIRLCHSSSGLHLDIQYTINQPNYVAMAIYNTINLAVTVVHNFIQVAETPSGETILWSGINSLL